MGIQIGPVAVPHPVILAPMSGVTDPPFRRLVEHLGGVPVKITVTLFSGADSWVLIEGFLRDVYWQRDLPTVEPIRGVVEDEGFIDLSNVLLVNPTDNKPSRVRIEERDGKRVRVFTRGGELVPDPVAAG